MSNKESITQNRRDFLKYLGSIILGGFIVLWYFLTENQLKFSGVRGFQKIDLSGKPDGYYFFDTFIASKKGASVKIFSNRCTHAGCKVNKAHNDVVVCACHGSTYGSSGEVLRGPAIKNLRQLPFSIDPVTGLITVKL